MLEQTLRILHNELWKAFYETAIMMGISFVLSLVLGLLLGFALYLTESDAFFRNRALNAIASGIVNFIRSIPFIILVVFTLPLTFWLVGTKIGPVAASVPMTIAATVFLARLVEGGLKEVDPGIIEAALATGARSLLIVRKVLLREAAPSIARAVTVVFINLIGCSAMAGMVGGGGIGNLAVQYGYYRYETGVMVFTIVVLVIIVQISQHAGDWVASKFTH
ncbi:MAG: methionine ABC transporter permease [Succinivibrio sp.]